MSEVASNSTHEAISLNAVSAFGTVAHLIRREVPIILESVISPDFDSANASRTERFKEPLTAVNDDGTVSS